MAYQERIGSVNMPLLTRLFLLMIVLHVAHVFEEVWGRFWLIQAVFGLGWFLVGNWILFCVPVVLFYFVLQGNRSSYMFSIIYAGVMTFNGLGHNVAVVVTGRYFDGFAGGYTGIGLVLVGLPMIWILCKAMVNCRNGRTDRS